MANIQTRSTVVAVKKEVTEGVPVVPTSGADAIAIQDDFTMEPAFDTLDNAEVKASIGAAKTILGNENPTASLSHYLKASGTAGTAPNYGELVESFMGGVSAAVAEYDTVAASTTTVVKVDTGEGATFERGEFLLIKDPTNGYRVRPIDSIASNDLSIGFQLPTAPAAGVNLGQCVLYKPANTGHPTVNLWAYLGNGGAIEMMAGGRVTSMNIDAAAGEFINANYSIEGLSAYFNPIQITATSKYLDFTDDGGTFAAVVSEKWFKDPHQLADALQSAMNDVSAEDYTVTYSDTTGKFTIATATSAVLSLLWNTGTNAANSIGTKLGFLVAANDTGALTYTSDNAQNFAFPFTASYDPVDPNVAKNIEVMVGDTADYLCFEASNVSISGSNTKADLTSLCAESGKSGSIITERTFEINITARLSQYDADMWRRFREGSNTKFQMTCGPKTGTNWTPGKVAAVYCPTATVTSFAVADADGLAVLEMTLTAYVNDSGEGEFYIGYV
jgi:hypothetical protein